MNKKELQRGLYVIVGFLISFGLSIFCLIYPDRPDYQSIIDIRSYPRAQVVGELRFLEPNETSQATLHSTDNVATTSRWYMENLSGTGWLLDVPPENPEDEFVQQIRLAKPGYRLSISLISDGKGGTDIIFEQIKKPDVDKDS